jgi:hypothetical protein
MINRRHRQRHPHHEPCHRHSDPSPGQPSQPFFKCVAAPLVPYSNCTPRLCPHQPPLGGTDCCYLLYEWIATASIVHWFFVTSAALLLYGLRYGTARYLYTHHLVRCRPRPNSNGPVDSCRNVLCGSPHIINDGGRSARTPKSHPI